MAHHLRDDVRHHPTARAATELTRSLHEQRRSAPRPAFAPAAGGILLLITMVLTAAQWELIGYDPQGQANSLRDTGLAILIGFAGLRLAFSTGRQVVAALVAMAAGFGLTLAGFLAEHEHTALAALEVGCGVMAIAAALSALASPSRWRGRSDAAIE